MTARSILVALALVTLVGCGPEDWCKAEQKAHAVASTVLPALSMLAPDKADLLGTSLATAHAGVLAVGCDGDKVTLGDRVMAVAEIAGQVLALYGQLRGRDIGPPVMTEAERLQAIADLAKLQAAIARERGR